MTIQGESCKKTPTKSTAKNKPSPAASRKA